MFDELMEEMASLGSANSLEFIELMARLTDSISSIEEFSVFLKFLGDNLGAIISDREEQDTSVYIHYFALYLLNELNPERLTEKREVKSGYATIAWAMFAALCWE
jgi:hypothetical protein